jgi:hypothetical protein
MKSFILIFLLLISSLSNAHDYFFAFAEVEYNELNGEIETTISMTSHDFERYLQKKKLIQTNLNACVNDSVSMQNIEIELNKHFNINMNPGIENSILDGNESFNLKLDGFEIQLTGIVQFYLSSTIFRPLKHFKITFDLLMDEYPEQQNKLTFIYRNQKKTVVFIPSMRSQIIDLD